MLRIWAAAQCQEVAIFGLGNVALDCARVLLRDEAVLGRTDIARHAQNALRRSAVKRVDIIGRRGPVQVRLPLSGSAGCNFQSMPLVGSFCLLAQYLRQCLRYWLPVLRCACACLCRQPSQQRS